MSESKVDVLLEVKLPVNIFILAGIAKSIGDEYGAAVSMRQVGGYLQFIRDREVSDGDNEMD